MYYVYLTYTFIYIIFSTDSQLRINLPTIFLLLRQQEKCYVLKILLFSVFCLFNLPTNRKQKTVRFLDYPFSLKKFYYIIYIYIILYNNIILEKTYPFKNQTVFCFLFVSFVNKTIKSLRFPIFFPIFAHTKQCNYGKTLSWPKGRPHLQEGVRRASWPRNQPAQRASPLPNQGGGDTERGVSDTISCTW